MIEHWTGKCVKSGILQPTVVSKKQCLKLGFNYYAFDTSGHSFLLTYSILVLVEEFVLLKYIYSFKQYTLGQKKEYMNKPCYAQIDFKNFDKRIRYVFPCITMVTLFASCLSLIWDLMLIITSVYYHTIFEKVLGNLLAILNWYLVYPVLFKKLDML